MPLNEIKTRFRKMIIVLSIVAAGFSSGCVSASLDDIGLESSSLSAPAAQSGIQTDTNLTAISAPTPLNAAVNSVDGKLAPNTVSSSVIALRENDIAPVSASNAIIGGNIAAAPNRASGLAEIRAKAATIGAETPNINDIPSERGRHFTAEELRLKKALLRAEAQAAQGLITETELTQKRAQIAALRRKAGSHYNQAVRQISK